MFYFVNKRQFACLKNAELNIQDIMSFWLTDDASSSAVFPQSVSFPASATQSAFSHQQSSNQEANGEYSKLKSLNLINGSETSS